MSSFIEFLNQTSTSAFFGILLVYTFLVYCVAHLFVVLFVNCLENCMDKYEEEEEHIV